MLDRHRHLMLQPFRGIGRRLRGLVLPLVGFWHLLAKLEDLRAHVEGLETATNTVLHSIAPLQHRIGQVSIDVAAQLDALTNMLTTQQRAVITTMAAEIDRLDGYISYHAAMLRDSIATIRSDHAALVRDSTATIRADVNPLRESLRTLTQRPQRTLTAPGLDALVVTAGFDLIVPTTEAGLLAYILRHGLTDTEPGVRAVIRDHLKPGAVAVDAGANIGIHAITMAAAVGPSGTVVCFEPLPHLATALQRTLHINGFSDRARVRQVALSDTIGETTFYQAAHAPMSSLYQLPEELRFEAIPMRTVTLDECFAPGLRVDLVKIDIEGAEPRMWRGMQRILDENVNIQIILEWSASHFGRTGEDPVAFMATIRAAGFTPYLIDDNGTAGALTPLQHDAEAIEAKNLFLTRRPVAQSLEAAS